MGLGVEDSSKRRFCREIYSMETDKAINLPPIPITCNYTRFYCGLKQGNHERKNL